MKKMLERLQEITKDCREDMHEPDQQEIRAVVTGNHLDNAMGHDPEETDELIVALMRTTPSKEYPNYNNVEVAYFNLATLIALARKAKLG